MTIELSENKPRRRDKLVIMAEIIDIARKGSSKTHIMFKANLSFSQLNLYLSALIRTGLLEKCVFNGKEIYRATKSGLDFMEKQCQIIHMLNADIKKSNIKTSFQFIPFVRPNMLIHSTP